MLPPPRDPLFDESQNFKTLLSMSPETKTPFSIFWELTAYLRPSSHHGAEFYDLPFQDIWLAKTSFFAVNFETPFSRTFGRVRPFLWPISFFKTPFSGIFSSLRPPFHLPSNVLKPSLFRITGSTHTLGGTLPKNWYACSPVILKRGGLKMFEGR